ncbi:hypothetical protein BV898_02402 [Hypsibius exemplaris]|nr:hypothetical protein BV898_02402 [Hypsibius exemplaris]
MNTKYSIGYIGSSEARDALLPDARILNRDNNWVRPTVETTQAAMDNLSTDLGARLTGSLVNAPGFESYPIAGYTYILIRRTITTGNCTSAMELYRMFSFLLDSRLAKSIVTDLINAPLSGMVLKQVKKHALSEMRCQGEAVSELVAVRTSIENGSYDAWKVPVIVLSALFGVALIVLTVFLLYVKYKQNRSALRNAFVIRLNVVETAKSVGSLYTVASANTSKNNNSKTQNP